MASREAKSETARFNVGGTIFEILRVPTLSSHPESLLSILLEQHDQAAAEAQRKRQDASGGPAKRRRLRKETEAGSAAGSRKAGATPEGTAGAGAAASAGSGNEAGTSEGASASSGSGVDREGAIFVNRNPDLFSYILDYYQNGRIIIPHCVAKAAVLREAAFYGLTQVTEDTIEREGSSLIETIDVHHDLLEQAREDNRAGKYDAAEKYLAHKLFKLFFFEMEHANPTFPITVHTSELEGHVGRKQCKYLAEHRHEGVVKHCNDVGASFGVKVEFFDAPPTTGFHFRRNEPPAE